MTTTDTDALEKRIAQAMREEDGDVQHGPDAHPVTDHPIDTEALRARAEHVYRHGGPANAVESLAANIPAILDRLAAAEHRATRAEDDRDDWRDAATKIAASSNQANADLYEAETRIERLENRAETETARADEWRRRHRVMAGKRDAAHRAYVEEREARREAEVRIKAMEDVLSHHPYGGPEQEDAVRRALDGDA